MSLDELNGDISNLSRLIRDLKNRKLTAAQLQEDLETLLQGFHQQTNVAPTLRIQWEHMKNDKAFFLAGAPEQLLLVSRCIRTAYVTKEKILNLGTRYVLTDLIYEQHVQASRSSRFDREDWMSEEHEFDVHGERLLEQMNRQRILLDPDIKDMEHYLAMAERSVYQAPSILTSDQVTEMFRREIEVMTSTPKGPTNSDFEMLQAKLDEQTAEMERLKEKLASMEELRVRDVRESNDGRINVTVKGRPSDQIVQVEQIEDQDYWARMVKEVSGPELPALVSEPSSDDEGEPQMKSRKVRVEPEDSYRVNELTNQIRQMERDFESFPFRKREEFSPGIEPDITCAFCGICGEHFSDSCPRVQNGDTRFDIIRGRLLCIYCLEDCPSSARCKYKHRQCWYCSRVRGTAFEDLMPNDDGHHHSLCNIPDKKHLAMRRITSARRELAELQRKSSDGDKDNNARSEE